LGLLLGGAAECRCASQSYRQLSATRATKRDTFWRPQKAEDGSGRALMHRLVRRGVNEGATARGMAARLAPDRTRRAVRGAGVGARLRPASHDARLGGPGPLRVLPLLARDRAPGRTPTPRRETPPPFRNVCDGMNVRSITWQPGFDAENLQPWAVNRL
jgi:hypothetical protein